MSLKKSSSFPNRFNLRIYERVRKEYDCERAFPHIYEKISKLGRS